LTKAFDQLIHLTFPRNEAPNCCSVHRLKPSTRRPAGLLIGSHPLPFAIVVDEWHQGRVALDKLGSTWLSENILPPSGLWVCVRRRAPRVRRRGGGLCRALRSESSSFPRALADPRKGDLEIRKGETERGRQGKILRCRKGEIANGRGGEIPGSTLQEVWPCLRGDPKSGIWNLESGNGAERAGVVAQNPISTKSPVPHVM
jgi:hypothetical protein